MNKINFDLMDFAPVELETVAYFAWNYAVRILNLG